MAAKLFSTGNARLLRTFQWVLPLVLVVIDLAFDCNDSVGLICWTFFIISLVLWPICYMQLGGNLTNILELLLTILAFFSFGIAVLFSFWDFYGSLKYANGMGSQSVIYGMLCLSCMYVNMCLFSSYVSAIFIDCVVGSPYGLRRKERRDVMFQPQKFSEATAM